MMAARVAGVPRPRRSASFGGFSLPAFSMADKRVSSEYRSGGVVFPSLTEAVTGRKVMRSFRDGRPSASSSRSRLLSVARKAASSAFHPGCTVLFPLAVKETPSHSSRAVVSSITHASPAAQSRRAATSVSTLLSPAGRASSG